MTNNCAWGLWALLFVHYAASCYVPMQLSVSRPGARLAALEDKIYFIGSVQQNYSHIIDVFDTTSNSWSGMTLEPARTALITLGVGSKYLVFIGGQLTAIDYYRYIDIRDVTTNEQYSIPFPDSWFRYATGLGINIYRLQKIVVYSVDQLDLLVIDPETRFVSQIIAPGRFDVNTAVTNGTHLFVQAEQRISILDVETLTWSEFSELPVPVGPYNLVGILPSINAIAMMRRTNQVTLRMIAMNGTEIKVINFAAGRRFSLVRFSEASINIIESGALIIIRAEDFEQIQYHLPQTFFNNGVYSIERRGVIYATSSVPTDQDIFTINMNALFTRAQFNLTLEDLEVVRTVGDTIVAIGQNIHWFDMNTQKFNKLDWPTRRRQHLIPVVGQYLVIASGRDMITNEPSDALDIFDATTQTWTSHTMPFAFIPGKVYGAGNYAFFFFGVDNLHVLNVKTNNWQVMTMGRPQDVDLVNNKLFGSYYRTLDIFDMATGIRTKSLNLYSVQGLAVGPYLYFGVAFPSNNVILYDTRNGTDQRSQLPVTRNANVMRMEVVQDRYVIIAGGTPRNRVDVFDTVTFTWSNTVLQEYARGDNVLMTPVNDIVILVRNRRIDQLNPATLELSEIVLEVDDIIRVSARGSKVILISHNSVTIYETSTGEYFTARFDTFTVNDPTDNFIFASSGDKIEFRPVTRMTGVMNGASLFEGFSTSLATSAQGPIATVRWSHNGVVMPDMNDRFMLQLNNVTGRDNGTYRIEVRDLCNQRMQQYARVDVHGRPFFIEPLRDTIDLCDEPADIETLVRGMNMTLEWRINDQIQPTMLNESVTIAPGTLQCDTSYSLCLTATNPAGGNTTCASLRIVKVDSLFVGPRPTTTQPEWYTDTRADLEVNILDSDCTSHTWLMDNQIVSQHASLHSIHSVNMSLLMKNREFVVVAQCGNSEVRSRVFVFQNLSPLKVGELVAAIVLPIMALVAAIIIAILVRRRLAKSQSTEMELQTLLTQAKTDSLRRDGVSVIPSTKWEWTPSDDFTYRPVDALPCSVDLSMIKLKSEPMRIDVWMQNEMVFSLESKNKGSKVLKERLLDGLHVEIFSPQSPKYEVRVEPESFVVKEGKSVHVTVSSMMRMTAKCKISLVLVLDQHKIYSAIEYKIESVMSTWIDLDEIQQTGEYLGGGGFGSVVKGVYRGQQVAVKRLLSQYLTPDMKIEFEREVTLMKDLRHPNIVSFVGASNVGDNLAIVIEYAPLGSLSSVMQKTKLSLPMKLIILYETAKAIQFLHMNSVIHRDIKPQNILVFSLEPKSPVHIKLTDFGTSRFITEDKMTVTKNVGTICYMAPEALGRNPRIDKSADIYGFAILMWEVIAEQQPFDEFQWDSAIESHVNEGKRLPLDMISSINSSLAKLIDDCWEQDPDERPQINSIVERLSSLL